MYTTRQLNKRILATHKYNITRYCISHDFRCYF
nr:MAG TPA: hypothetical protein [Caudoviricetes sp.]